MAGAAARRLLPLRAGRRCASPAVTSAAPRSQKSHATRCSRTAPVTREHRSHAQPHAGTHSFHFISFHFISFHFISFHFISFHFISFHFISFHFISFHFISFHFISFHFISFHFVSFRFVSFRFVSFRFVSFRFVSFRFVSFRFISFHFIHIPPWLVSQGGHVRAVAQCVRATPVSAHSCSALSVCVLWCMWSHTSFHARGARPSPLAVHPNPKGRHTATAGRDHIHQHTFSVASLPGGEANQGSRGSTAQRSLCMPLPLVASGIRNCEDQKNSEATRQDGKMHGAKRSKLHAANLSTWRAPLNTKMPQEPLKISVDVETIENPPSNHPATFPDSRPQAAADQTIDAMTTTENASTRNEIAGTFG